VPASFMTRVRTLVMPGTPISAVFNRQCGDLGRAGAIHGRAQPRFGFEEITTSA